MDGYGHSIVVLRSPKHGDLLVGLRKGLRSSPGCLGNYWNNREVFESRVRRMQLMAKDQW